MGSERALILQQQSENGMNERLAKARVALQTAEARHGLSAFEVRDLGFGKTSTVPQTIFVPGLHPLETNPAGIIHRLAPLFTEPLWVAVVNVANMGWEAAWKAGWNLAKTVVVKCSQSQGVPALSELLESIDVIVVGDLHLSFGQQRILAAKARKLNRMVLDASLAPTVLANTGASLTGGAVELHA